MKNGATPKRDYSHGAHLEPRVAKLELGMERLTDDVRDLAQVVRSQGQNMEGEIQKLVIAVTQAAGPKKTDWGTIIAGLALIMAIGSAAFWPLNQTVQESKASVQHLEQKYDDHAKIANHPVGEALIQCLEEQLKSHVIQDDKDKEEMMAEFKEHLDLSKQACEAKFAGLNEKVTLHNDRLYNRVVKLEDYAHEQTSRELDELSKWRQKAMGLDSDSTPKK